MRTGAAFVRMRYLAGLLATGLISTKAVPPSPPSSVYSGTLAPSAPLSHQACNNASERSATQKGRRQPFMSANASECQLDGQTACILLEPKSGHACSIGRRSLTTPVQSKEEGGSLCRQAAPAASASQTRYAVCILLAPQSSRKLVRLVADA